MNMQALGIDIGGTGIKGAPVDLATGKLLADRKKIATPSPSTPDAVTEVVRELVQAFSWSGVIGATFPGVVAGVTVLNDADAAGVAEMTFGAGVGVKGTVLMLTFGTGVGSALFTDGTLVRNTEFGHIEIRGKDAEKRASEHAKVTRGWGWKDWTERVSEYLQHVEALLSPDLIIVGGGISKEADKRVPLLTGIRAKIFAAALQNGAGIVGGAIAAAGTAGGA